jgi:hypothetical protein
MPTTTAQEVKRVPHSEELLHPGDFVFIPKRQPAVTFHSVPLEPSKGWGRRMRWNLFGTKYEIQKTVTPVWPDADTVILNCPICNRPFGTTAQHKITSTDPEAPQLRRN